MNQDLFLAILAMDSYNRGYDPGILGLTVILGQSRIGNATIIRQSSVLSTSDDVRAGFYALAYDVSSAGIVGLSGAVVSYRGSDNFLGEGGLESALRGELTGNINDNDIFNAIPGTPTQFRGHNT